MNAVAERHLSLLGLLNLRPQQATHGVRFSNRPFGVKHLQEAQMQWALAHGGDRELLDLLRMESVRLFLKTEAIFRSHDCPADHKPGCDPASCSPIWRRTASRSVLTRAYP
jgi:hypothetical protein